MATMKAAKVIGRTIQKDVASKYKEGHSVEALGFVSLACMYYNSNKNDYQ